MGDSRGGEMTVVSALEALGLDWRATMAEVRRSYRRLSLKYHPDRVLDDGYKAQAQRRFLEIRNAYEFLRRRPQALRGGLKGTPARGGSLGGADPSSAEFERLLSRYRELHGVRPSQLSEFLSRVIEGGGWLGESLTAVAVWMFYVAFVAALLVWRR